MKRENAMRGWGGALAAASVAGTMLTAGSGQAELIYAVTNGGFLVSFDSADPGAVLSGKAISGLQTNETIQGIDFRPSTGELFGVGSYSNLYKLSTSTGAVSLVGTGFANNAESLNGSAFGFDFNPTIDRIRNVSNQNQNLVLNPITGASTGAAASVVPVFYGAADPNVGQDPNIVHSAYTNSFAGATTSQLYGIDSELNILVTQANSAGTLGTVGSLGFDATTVGGFDISGTTGIAYLAAQDAVASGVSKLYTVNLLTGAAMPSGLSSSVIAGGQIITAIAVAVPEPGSLALMTLACGALLGSRRKRMSA